MARTLAVEALQTLEQGRITFLYRPRVEEQHPEELDDMQRLFILLAPDGSAYQRLIAIGRKRLPRSARRERFWGFVDLVLTDNDMSAALDAQVYGTKTPDLRHLPAARAVASGSYEIEMHSSHSHLRWQIAPFENVVEIEIEPSADYIVTIANPDPAVWGLVDTPDLQAQLFDDLELHVPLPTPLPPALQDVFQTRRFVQLDTTDWLDHPGAELVFIGT